MENRILCTKNIILNIVHNKEPANRKNMSPRKPFEKRKTRMETPNRQQQKQRRRATFNMAANNDDDNTECEIVQY